MPNHQSPPDEQPDLALVTRYFMTLGIATRRFSIEETQRGSTPDFRLVTGQQEVGFCEVKSPNDRWLEEQLAEARPWTLVGGARQDPIFNRLSRQILKAGSQFNAVNAGRTKLNILAFVNHDTVSTPEDLREVLTGHFHTEDGQGIPTMLHMAERLGAVRDAIDAYLWFDGATGRLASAIVGQTDPARTARTCSLLGVRPSQLRAA